MPRQRKAGCLSPRQVKRTIVIGQRWAAVDGEDLLCIAQVHRKDQMADVRRVNFHAMRLDRATISFMHLGLGYRLTNESELPLTLSERLWEATRVLLGLSNPRSTGRLVPIAGPPEGTA